MWNRRAFLLWFSIRIEGKHRFHLALPIPLFLFLMFTDTLEDLSSLTSLFWPKNHYRNWHGIEVSPALIMSITSVCSGLSRELFLHTQPTDLMDIDVTDEINRVRIKCLIR